MTNKNTVKSRPNGNEGVSRGIAALGAGLALAVGFFLGFTVHGMLGGKTPPPAQTMNTPTQVPSGPAAPQANAPTGAMADRIRAVEKQVQLEPNNPAAWTELGNLYFDTDQPDKAIAAYEKSLTLKPGDPDVLTDQGVMYRQVHQFDKALECFDKAIKANPGHTIASYNKSIVLEHDKNDKAGALAALKALAATNPNAILPGGRTVAQAIQDMTASQ